MSTPSGSAPKASTPIKDRLGPETIIQNYYGAIADGRSQHDSSPRFILGYWSTRCLGAPIRMMLSAAQTNHWVVMYDSKEAEPVNVAVVSDGASSLPLPVWDKSSWLHDKEWLKEDFPLINLPYLVDCTNDRVISQTNAISLYLGRELNFLGRQNKEDVSLCEELLFYITDLRDLMVDFAYKTDQSTCEEDAKKLLKDARVYFERLESHLMREYPHAMDRRFDRDERTDQKSISHLVGGTFTVPDFHLWEILDQFEGLCERFSFPNCLGDARTYSAQVDTILRYQDQPKGTKTVFPYLKEFKDSFMHLPANEAYGTMYGLLTDTATDGAEDNVDVVIKLPYNNPYARFGGCPDPTKIYRRGQEAPWRSRGVIQKRHPQKSYE